MDSDTSENVGKVILYRLVNLEGTNQESWQELDVSVTGDGVNDQLGWSVSFSRMNPNIFAVADPKHNNSAG